MWINCWRRLNGCKNALGDREECGMNRPQRNLLFWTVVLALFLIQLYLEMRQGTGVKYIGRIALLTVIINHYSRRLER